MNGLRSPRTPAHLLVWLVAWLTLAGASCQAGAGPGLTLTPGRASLDLGLLDPVRPWRELDFTFEFPGALTLHVAAGEPWRLLALAGGAPAAGDPFPPERLAWRAAGGTYVTFSNGFAPLPGVGGSALPAEGLDLTLDLRVTLTPADLPARCASTLTFVLAPEAVGEPPLPPDPSGANEVDTVLAFEIAGWVALDVESDYADGTIQWTQSGVPSGDPADAPLAFARAEVRTNLDWVLSLAATGPLASLEAEPGAIPVDRMEVLVRSAAGAAWTPLASTWTALGTSPQPIAAGPPTSGEAEGCARVLLQYRLLLERLTQAGRYRTQLSYDLRQP